MIASGIGPTEIGLILVAVLLLFGGASIQQFVAVLLIGLVSGTYSSIFIAAPIVLWWSGKGGRDLRAEIKSSEAPKPAAA